MRKIVKNILGENVGALIVKIEILDKNLTFRIGWIKTQAESYIKKNQ